MKLLPYANYKPSGCAWLGLVPAHWDVMKLKRWVSVNKETLPETTDPKFKFLYLDIGTVGTDILLKEPDRYSFENSPSRARRVVKRNDTIISTVRTYLQSTWLSDRAGPVVCSTGFSVLTPVRGTIPKFVSYLAQSNSFTDQVTAESVGIAYPSIAEGRFGSMVVCVPPISEQVNIVAALSHITSICDGLIRKRTEQVKLLKEKKRFLIYDTVTKCDGKKKRFKYVASWDRGSRNYLSSDLCGDPVASSVPYLSLGYLRDECSAEMVATDPNLFLADEGEILLLWDGANAGEFFRSKHGAIGSTIAKIVPIGIDADFLYWVCKGNEHLVRSAVTGMGIPHVNPDFLGDIRVQIPSEKHQKNIATFLDREISRIDLLTKKIQGSIELLREYRLAFISAAVTGKIDLRRSQLV